jgi:hypothetical protein
VFNRNNKLAICIPSHKNKLTLNEVNNIKITNKTNKYVPKFFILPESIKADFFKKKFPNIKIIYFKDKHFTSEMNYNRFLLKKSFSPPDEARAALHRADARERAGEARNRPTVHICGDH